MNVLIIEDESLAASRLISLLHDYDRSIVILDQIDSVKSAVKWFIKHAQPDLVFMDIQLGDGLSFEIFDHCKINCPVIFTTAFDQYAIQAFKVNSIDYLLKPFDKNDIDRALSKLNNLKDIASNSISDIDLTALKEIMKTLSEKYKNRFIVKVGDHIHSVQVQHILFFFSEEKTTFAQVNNGQKFILDHSLEQVSTLVNPELFFKINRKYIIHINSITDIISFTNSRLKLRLKNSNDSEIIVSRDNVQRFKQWLDR